MSNNNHPHSHLSQAAAAAAQNPSWNPLQIPSYIPRQPQLAHMSNERPMVRSPLAWQQPPPPPDAIYNFMSANHKNLDHHHQMNPLLAPPYTGTLPFDSMDLSLQSTRSAAPPLTKSGLPQQQQQQQQQSHGNAQHQQQQQQSHLHAPPPNFPSIHNLSTSNASTQQEHLAVLAAVHAERLHNSNNLNASAIPTPTSTPNVTATPSKYLNANGSDCESLLPPPPPTTTTSTSTATASNHTSSSSSSSGPGSGNNNLSSQSPNPHYMHQNRDDSFKLSQLKQRNFEKDKECRLMQPQQPSLGNKKPSPLRNYHHQQQQQAQQQQQQSPYNMTPKYNGPQTPPTPQSPLAGPLPPPPHQMDYNQLHLHHQLGGGYQHMQQSGPAASQDQHLHYHNQHVLPSHHPTHISSAQFHAQANLPGQQQLPPQHQPAQAGPPMHHHSRNSQQLTNLDLLPKQPKPTDMDIERERDEQTVITDLSYRHTTTTPALPPPPASSSSSGETEKPAAPSTASHDAPESPYLTTSNEESLESNSNSNSNSRKRRKRKSSLVMRLTPSENASATKHTHGNSSSSPKQTTKNGTSSVGGDFQPFQQTEIPMVMENGRASSPAQTENSNSNNSTSLYNDDNPKTKKQRQALLQRNLTEQQQHRHHPIPEDEPVANPTPPTTTVTMPPPPSPQSNSSSSSSSSSSHSSRSSHDEKQQPEPAIINNKSTTDTPASPALVEQGDIDAKPAVSVHEQEDDDNEVDEVVTTKTDDNSKAPETSHKPPTPPVESTATSAPSSEPIVVPPNTAEPRHFGEVEDKLEQMFAGIEEETEAPAEKPAEQEAKVNDVVGHDLSAQLAMDSAKSEEIKPTPPLPEVRPIATKAAMKSTLPSPIHSPILEARSTSTPLPESQLAEESQDSSKSQPVRSAPQRRLPQRRLSIGMDAALLRFTLDDTASQAKTKKTVGRKKLPDPEDSDDDDKPSTSAAAAAALAARNKLNETTNIKNNNSKTSTTTTKKSPIAKGKSKKAAVGKNNNKNSKQNGKNSKGGGGRKPISTDEDSTPAPPVNGGSSSLPDLKFKSPYILIKPDGTFSIKNTHSSEDINEKQTKAKKAPHERKNLRGMHSSTLSNRYDADTTDSSWICVFCKRGPHKLGLGDLFGPYLVSIDCDEYRAALHSPGVQDIDGLFVSKRKRGDMVKAQQRNLPVVQASLANIMQAPKISMHKRKRKQSAQDSNNSFSDDQFDMQSRCSSSMADPLDYSQENKMVETFRGMCKTSEHGYEIWLHEDCAIWTNDIQLIGAHVNGLDAAVWDSTRYQCVHCSQTGANVCCFQRSCKATAHVPCARSANWHLNEHERKVFCQLHGPSEGSHAPAAVEEPAAGTIGNDSMALESLQFQPPVLLNINSLP